MATANSVNRLLYEAGTGEKAEHDYRSLSQYCLYDPIQCQKGRGSIRLLAGLFERHC